MSKIKEPKCIVDGATWKRFYSDSKLWEPAGECWHEDEVFWVDGEEVSEDYDMEAVPDTSRVSVVSGTYYDRNGDSHDFAEVFQKWVKANGVEVVAVSKARLEALEKCYRALVRIVSADATQELSNEEIEAGRAAIAKVKGAGS